MFYIVTSMLTFIFHAHISNFPLQKLSNTPTPTPNALEWYLTLAAAIYN